MLIIRIKSKLSFFDLPREKGKLSGGLSREKRKSIGWFIAREKGKVSGGKNENRMENHKVMNMNMVKML